MIRIIALLLLFAPTASAETGLIFPTKGDQGDVWDCGASVAFKWDNPSQNGLPLVGTGSGAGRSGVTYMWEYLPRQQTGYHTTFFYGRGDGSFDLGGVQSFYGAHPYPIGGAGGSTHNWEISGTDDFGDFQNTGPLSNQGPPRQVVKDVWYKQALVIDVQGDNTKLATFYIDLPNVATTDFIQHESQVGWGNDTSPLTDELLQFGDAPWCPTVNHERMGGTFRNLRIWVHNLSEAEILAKSGSDAQLLKSGETNLWYHNPNPTPTDISDKSGSPTHNPSWLSASRPTLYVGDGGDEEPAVPAPPILLGD